MTPAIPNASAGPGTPPVAAPFSRSIPVWGWALALVGVVALIVLWRIEPAGQSFFPRCWLHQTTGLQCPGCGATRAVHEVLNGRIRDAFRLNALVVLALPFLAGMGLRQAWGLRTGRWWPNPLESPWVIAVLAGLVLGFGVGRNIG